MNRLLALAFIVSMLDAVTTYVLIATHRGVEANPFMQFLNVVPEAVFFVQFISIFGLVSLLKGFEILAAILPTALRTQVHKAAAVAFIVAIACRVAVVVNNTLGILIGVTPLVGHA